MLKEHKDYTDKDKKLSEGLVYNVSKENEDLKTLEVTPEVSEKSKIQKDDKQSFEEFKSLYDGKIKDKCLADYGTCDDAKLLEDTAKEMFLQSMEYVPTEDTKVEGQLEDKLEESKELEESRDRVAETLSKFIYDLTSSDFDKYGETAWSGNAPTKNAAGVTLYEVYKNGKSDYSVEDVKNAVLEKYPELMVEIETRDGIFFKKVEKKTESVEVNKEADDLIKRYFDFEYDLETLHNELEKVFGNKKDAVEYFTDNEYRIKNRDNLKEDYDKDAEHYKLGQLDKISGDSEDTYTIKVTNTTKDISTKYMNVGSDIIDLLKDYFRR